MQHTLLYIRHNKIFFTLNKCISLFIFLPGIWFWKLCWLFKWPGLSFEKRSKSLSASNYVKKPPQWKQMFLRHSNHIWNGITGGHVAPGVHYHITCSLLWIFLNKCYRCPKLLLAETWHSQKNCPFKSNTFRNEWHYHIYFQKCYQRRWYFMLPFGDTVVQIRVIWDEDLHHQR